MKGTVTGHTCVMTQTVKPLVLALITAGLWFSLPCMADIATSSVTAATSSSYNSKAVNVGKVNADAEGLSKKGLVLRSLNSIPPYKIINSTQSQLQVGKMFLGNLSPISGGIQLAKNLPGVFISGSNPSSSVGDNAIVINGFSVGSYSNTTASPNFNSIAVTFDGIPMNNPLSGDGGWYSAEIPIAALLSSANIVYGPGNPDSRWQASIGGTLNFIPVQPSAKASVKVAGSVGSYGASTESVIAQTGLHDGWATVIAGGYTSAKVPGLEYDYPSHAYSFYIKSMKFFDGDNNISLGLYGENSYYLDNTSVPVTPLAGYTTNGYNVPGPLLSQETTGFYSTIKPSQSNFYYRDNSLIFFTKQHFTLSKSAALDNQLWFRHSYRLHQGDATYYGDSSPTLVENYTPTDNTVGDRLSSSINLPFNLIKTGAYISNQNYHSQWNLYNPLYGTSISSPNTRNDVVMNQLNEYIYIQDNINLLGGRLVVTPGVGYAAYQTTVSNLFPPTGSSQANGVINDTLSPGSNTSFGGVEPSLGANLKLINGLHWYGNVAYTNENPNGEAYGDYYETIINPNNIGLTHNLDFESGFRYHKNRLFVNVNYYHDQVDNQIYGLYAQGTSFAPTGYDLANSLYQGVNFQLKWNPLYNVMLYSSANFQHSYYTSLMTSSGNSFSGNMLPGIPFHIFSFGATYFHALMNGVLTVHVDDHYIGSGGMANSITGDVTLRTSPYNLLNATASYKTPILNSLFKSVKYTTFKFGAYNLLNRHYNVNESVGSGVNTPGLPSTAVFGYQGAPLTLFGSMTIKF